MPLLHFHWDFRGPDAQPTADHFRKHLDEFCQREGIEPHRAWISGLQVRWIVTLECDEQHLAIVRDRLRPKRAERVG